MLEKHASSSQPAGIQRAMALQGRVAFAWPAHAALDRVSHGWTLSAIDSPPNFLDGCITMRRRAPGHDRTRMPDKSDPPDDERALRARLDALSGS